MCYPPFQGGTTGSNPPGDADPFQGGLSQGPLVARLWRFSYSAPSGLIVWNGTGLPTRPSAWAVLARSVGARKLAVPPLRDHLYIRLSRVNVVPTCRQDLSSSPRHYPDAPASGWGLGARHFPFSIFNFRAATQVSSQKSCRDIRRC